MVLVLVRHLAGLPHFQPRARDTRRSHNHIQATAPTEKEEQQPRPLNPTPFSQKKHSMFLTPLGFQPESQASPTSMVRNQDKVSQGGVTMFRASVELLLENQEQIHDMSNPTKILKMTPMIPRTLKSQIPDGPRLTKRTLLFREEGAGAFPPDSK